MGKLMILVNIIRKLGNQDIFLFLLPTESLSCNGKSQKLWTGRLVVRHDDLVVQQRQISEHI